MLLSRNYIWLFFGLATFFLISGCGDLEPEMQDTRSVVLKMNFKQSYSSRSSQITQADVSNHKTHLIVALPAWEQISSNYMNYYNSFFAADLMNPSENQVNLEIPLNTQMKIFAFIFSGEYTPDQLISGVSGVSYYGESPSFSIGTNTNNLSLGVTLQSAGSADGNSNEEDTAGTVDQGSTDSSRPSVSFSPANGTVGIGVSDNITITFSEKVRSIANTELTNNNIDNLITLKLNNPGGSNINFDATINTEKTVITINPASNLLYSQSVYVAIGSTVEDSADNAITAANATFTTVIDPSLEAYYPFNGNAEDLTSNVRNFTVYGNTSLTSGRDNSSNSAYYFDGNGDYLEYNTSIPSLSRYTITLWAKPDSTGTYEAMFASYNDASFGFQIDLDSSNNFHIRKASSSGGNITLNSATLGSWTFIAFTYDGTESKCYINSESPVSDSGGTNEFNLFRMGRNRNGNTYFKGSIDELRIYNRALSANEIQAIYSN
ncbi:Ig-like domain-containing protein [bacterium]|nr:Ig-like domain-containing protein [bacterium]